MPLSPRIVRRGLAVLAIATTAAALAGCEAEVSTGGDQIDEGSAELTIKRQYAEKFGDLKLVTVDCGTTDAEAGNTFTCSAENDNGVSLDIEAKINSVDEDGESFNFTWNITKAVTDGSAYEQPSVKGLRGLGEPVASVDCPEFEIVEGHKVECEATMKDGSKETAVLTLGAGDGDFQVKLEGFSTRN